MAATDRKEWKIPLDQDEDQDLEAECDIYYLVDESEFVFIDEQTSQSPIPEGK